MIFKNHQSQLIQDHIQGKLRGLFPFPNFKEMLYMNVNKTCPVSVSICLHISSYFMINEQLINVLAYFKMSVLN